MAEFGFSDLKFDSAWPDQGMITLMIPSTDKNVRPNVILSKEPLAQQIDLKSYFEKVKENIQGRQMQGFKILSETQISVSGVPAIQMVCQWDLMAMKQMLGEEGQGLQHIKPGQKVQQVQITFLKDQTAFNITGSFPAEQFDLYSRPFQKLLQSLKFVS